MEGAKVEGQRRTRLKLQRAQAAVTNSRPATGQVRLNRTLTEAELTQMAACLKLPECFLIDGAYAYSGQSAWLNMTEALLGGLGNEDEAGN